MPIINGTNFDDVLDGTASNDVIRGYAGEDEISGNDGSDRLYGGHERDTIYGGLGNDRLWGDDGNDSLFGDDQWGESSGQDYLSGGNGNDELQGGGGNDTLLGGNGYDYLVGGDGDDILHGDAADDYLDGGAGNDVIDGGVTSDPSWPSYWWEEDTVSFSGATAGVSVNLAAGTALDGQRGTDTLIDIEHVNGTAHDDILIGGNPLNDDWESFTGFAGNDTIDGGSGFDVIWYFYEFTGIVGQNRGIRADLAAGTIRDALGGIDTVLNVELIGATINSDYLFGSAGNDGFAPGLGDDYVDGGGGTDTVNYRYAINRTNLYFGIDVDLAKGIVLDSVGDLDRLASIENVVGSRKDDTIRGDGNANLLDGREGDDFLKGRAGDDELIGSFGADHLDGGAGLDRLEGGSGNDTLRGSKGQDVFVFDADSNEDHILDFRSGVDKIDVSAFGFLSAADVMSRFQVLSPGAAMLDLGNDNYVIFDYVNTAGTVLAGADIIV